LRGHGHDVVRPCRCGDHRNYLQASRSRTRHLSRQRPWPEMPVQIRWPPPTPTFDWVLSRNTVSSETQYRISIVVSTRRSTRRVTGVPPSGQRRRWRGRGGLQVVIGAGPRDDVRRRAVRVRGPSRPTCRLPGYQGPYIVAVEGENRLINREIYPGSTLAGRSNGSLTTPYTHSSTS